MTFDLAEKHVLVCGAMGHLGQALSEALAQEGCHLTLCDLDAEKMAQRAQDLSAAHSVTVKAIALDVRNEASIENVFATLRLDGKQLHAVINTSYPRNANYGRHVEDVTLADFSENLSWHLGGYFGLSKHACQYLAKAGGGSLVNISSIYGSMAPRFQIYENTPMTTPVEYAAIKSGVLHLTRYFAQYYKKKGVRANAVSPGGLLAGQPASFLEAYKSFSGTKGMLDASDTLGAILFLVSDASRYMTGQDIIIDDGFSL